jgi:indole-3-glycerol phosphate synthase
MTQLTSNKNLNVLAIFKEEDLHNIVGVTMDVVNSRDLVKLQFHLQTLKNMVNNSNKLALMLC